MRKNYTARISRAYSCDAKDIAEIVQKDFSYLNSNEGKIVRRLENQNIKIFKIVFKKKIVGILDLEFLEKNAGRINGLVVLEKFRGKSFGKKLLKKGMDFFRENGVEKIVLLVNRKNKIAKSIYSEFGFVFARAHHKKIAGKIVEEFELNLAPSMQISIS